MAYLSKSEVTLTLALILLANQRPLTFEEFQQALDGAGYHIPPIDTLHALNQGPFLCCADKWLLTAPARA
jgi:hypothetical protein